MISIISGVTVMHLKALVKTCCIQGFIQKIGAKIMNTPKVSPICIDNQDKHI